MIRALLACLLVSGAALAGEPVDTCTRWSDFPEIPVEVQEVGVAALDGKIYVIGGILSNRGPTGIVSRYDTVTGEWEGIPPLPDDTRLHHVGAAALDGGVWAVGGLNNNFRGVDTVFAYSPETFEWEQVASLNHRRGSMGVAAMNGKLYAAGGQSGGTSFDHFEVYSPAEDRWDDLPPLPTARNHLAAAAIDGVFYAVGGRAGSLRGELDAFTPGAETLAGSWESLEPMPTPRGGLAAAAFDGRLFVFGGEGNARDPGGVFHEVEVWDPVRGEWEPHCDMPNARHGIGVAVVGDLIHIPGGAPVQGFSTTDLHDAYAPERLDRGSLPGDCNSDGALDLSDGVCLLGHVFLGEPRRLPCGDGSAGDPSNLELLDANGDTRLDLSDAIGVFTFLFLGGSPPAGGLTCREIPGCSLRCDLSPQ